MVMTIQNVEIAEKWVESVDRVLACAAALRANVKAFEKGGASAENSMNATEQSREALRDALREEGARWKKMLEPPAQQEMPLEKGARGPKALPPKALQIGDGE